MELTEIMQRITDRGYMVSYRKLSNGKHEVDIMEPLERWIGVSEEERSYGGIITSRSKSYTYAVRSAYYKFLKIGGGDTHDNRIRS